VFPRLLTATALLFALALAGCRYDMQDQPRYEPLESSTFFDDGRASRAPVAGTVARGHLDEDTVFFAGVEANGAMVTAIPMPVDRALLDRGRERYDIYCSPCHDRVGGGAGMIVQRGYKQPPTFHDDRMRSLPPGYYYNVIRNGFGVMPSYAAQVPANDRWAIVAYIRALQRSQNATLADVPESQRGKLQGTP